jgi:hypothetical protein
MQRCTAVRKRVAIRVLLILDVPEAFIDTLSAVQVAGIDVVDDSARNLCELPAV